MDQPGEMEPNTQGQTGREVNPRPYKLIASPWHTASVILILGFFAWRGAQQQERPSPLGGAAGASSTSFVSQYLLLIGAEILLAYWVFVGVHGAAERFGILCADAGQVGATCCGISRLRCRFG